MRKILLSSAVAVVFAASYAPAAAASGHWYVGVGGNYNATNSTYDTGVKGQGRSKLGWSLYVGRQANDWFATEFGYTSMGDIPNGTSGGADVQTDTSSFDVQGVLSHAVFSFGKVGMSAFATTGVSYLKTGDSDVAKFTGFVPTYGGGVSFDFSQKFALKLDLKRYDGTDNNNIDIVGFKFEYHMV
jgi:hypothetical protein